MALVEVRRDQWFEDSKVQRFKALKVYFTYPFMGMHDVLTNMNIHN